MTPWLVEDVSRLWVELTKAKMDKERLTAEKKVEVKARAAETERYLKKAQETIAVSDPDRRRLQIKCRL